MTETLTGNADAAGARVGDILTTGDGAHWYVDRIDRDGRFTAVPYDPTMPRWSQPGADPFRDLAAVAAASFAAGPAPLVRVPGQRAGRAVTLTLAGRRYIAVPRTDGPGYTLHDPAAPPPVTVAGIPVQGSGLVQPGAAVYADDGAIRG